MLERDRSLKQWTRPIQSDHSYDKLRLTNCPEVAGRRVCGNPSLLDSGLLAERGEPVRVSRFG